jgi:hypothetical protein
MKRTLARVLGKWTTHLPNAKLLLGRALTRVRVKKTPQEDKIKVMLFSGARLGFLPGNSTVAAARQLAKDCGFVASKNDAFCFSPSSGRPMKDEETCPDGVCVGKLDTAVDGQFTCERVCISRCGTTSAPGPGADEVTFAAHSDRQSELLVVTVVDVRKQCTVARWVVPVRPINLNTNISTHAASGKILITRGDTSEVFQLLRDEEKTVRRLTRARSQIITSTNPCLTGCGRYHVLVNGSTLVFRDLSGKKEHEEFEVPTTDAVHIVGPAAGSAVFCYTGTDTLKQLIKVTVGADRKMDEVYCLLGKYAIKAVDLHGRWLVVVNCNRGTQCTAVVPLDPPGEMVGISRTAKVCGQIILETGNMVRPQRRFWIATNPRVTHSLSVPEQRHGLALTVTGNQRTAVQLVGVKPQDKPYTRRTLHVNVNCKPLPSDVIRELTAALK